MHDLPLGEAQDALSESSETRVAGVVPLALVKLLAVDLDHEAVAQHEVDAIDADRHLPPNAHADLRRAEREDRLGDAAGTRGCATKRRAEGDRQSITDLVPRRTSQQRPGERRLRCHEGFLDALT